MHLLKLLALLLIIFRCIHDVIQYNVDKIMWTKLWILMMKIYQYENISLDTVNLRQMLTQIINVVSENSGFM